MVDSLLAPASGTVRLKLYKGSASIAGRKSPNSLYDNGLASFGACEEYSHADGSGFVRLFGLPTRVAAQRGLAGRVEYAAAKHIELAETVKTAAGD